jgi:hypothetical protein
MARVTADPIGWGFVLVAIVWTLSVLVAMGLGCYHLAAKVAEAFSLSPPKRRQRRRA